MRMPGFAHWAVIRLSNFSDLHQQLNCEAYYMGKASGRPGTAISLSARIIIILDILLWINHDSV